LNGYCLNDTRCLVLSLFVSMYFVCLFVCAYFIIGLWDAQTMIKYGIFSATKIVPNPNDGFRKNQIFWVLHRGQHDVHVLRGLQKFEDHCSTTNTVYMSI
jgi:hypothetical protein